MFRLAADIALGVAAGAAVAAVGGTGAFAPIVSTCFGIPVQLYNHHGKFLCGGVHNPHGHHDPNHGFRQSSWWYIERHSGFSDKVSLRNMNGKYLCHDGNSQYCSMHHSPGHNGVAWHMDMFPGFSGQNVIFRSHSGHYLGCDNHDNYVHAKQHFSGVPHESQRFEVRYINGYPPAAGAPAVVQQTTYSTPSPYPTPGVAPMVQQTTTAYGAPPVAAPYGAPPPGYGTPGYGTPGYPSNPGYGVPPGAPMVQQTTAYGAPPIAAPYGAPAPFGGPAVVQTTTFAPIVTSCFGRAVQLYNHYGKFLCGGVHKPHGHHNPNHGFNQSSYWFVEKHPGFSDKVRLRNSNGKYLCHEGGSQYCSMHHSPDHNGVSWHMDMFPGFSGQNVIFRSHHGHYLGCDRHDDLAHAKQHLSGQPHESQRFEVRYV